MKKLLLFLAIIFSTQSHALEFQGKFLQGHFILGKAEAGSKVFVDKTQVKVSKDGYFVFGIDRDRKFDLAITEINNGKKNKVIKKVFKRKYNIQRIDGLPESKVTPPESVYKRIKEENGRIGKARAINSAFLTLLYSSILALFLFASLAFSFVNFLSSICMSKY